MSVKPLREHSKIVVESMNANNNWVTIPHLFPTKFWLLSSYSSWKTGTSTCPRLNNYLFIYPMRIFSAKNMVTLVLGWQRMRKQSGKTTVPLDVVPERRTGRCSPRFRPGGRFWGEPSFRYLSPGREGEKCRPLDHRWQIPFIHSARFISSSNFYIYRAMFQLFPPRGRFKCTLVLCIFGNGACTIAELRIWRLRANI